MADETKRSPINYVPSERAPNAAELKLWDAATVHAKRVSLESYAMRSLFANLLQTHTFAAANNVTLSEPELPDLEMRMNKALTEIELLRTQMDKVSNLEMGIQVTSDGKDLNIVEPTTTQLGWVLPAVLGVVVVVGIIARWAQLEQEVGEITAQYNGILKRSDMALCEDPDSEMCQNWEHDKQTGGYYKRETIVENIKSAVKSIGTASKKGLGAGIAILIPLLALMWLPRRKKG